MRSITRKIMGTGILAALALAGCDSKPKRTEGKPIEFDYKGKEITAIKVTDDFQETHKQSRIKNSQDNATEFSIPSGDGNIIITDAHNNGYLRDIGDKVKLVDENGETVLLDIRTKSWKYNGNGTWTAIPRNLHPTRNGVSISRSQRVKDETRLEYELLVRDLYQALFEASQTKVNPSSTINPILDRYATQKKQELIDKKQAMERQRNQRLKRLEDQKTNEIKASQQKLNDLINSNRSVIYESHPTDKKYTLITSGVIPGELSYSLIRDLRIDSEEMSKLDGLYHNQAKQRVTTECIDKLDKKVRELGHNYIAVITKCEISYAGIGNESIVDLITHIENETSNSKDTERGLGEITSNSGIIFRSASKQTESLEKDSNSDSNRHERDFNHMKKMTYDIACKLHYEILDLTGNEPVKSPQKVTPLK